MKLFMLPSCLISRCLWGSLGRHVRQEVAGRKLHQWVRALPLFQGLGHWGQSYDHPIHLALPFDDLPADRNVKLQIAFALLCSPFLSLSAETMIFFFHSFIWNHSSPWKGNPRKWGSGSNSPCWGRSLCPEQDKLSHRTVMTSEWSFTHISLLLQNVTSCLLQRGWVSTTLGFCFSFFCPAEVSTQEEGYGDGALEKRRISHSVSTPCLTWGDTCLPIKWVAFAGCGSGLIRSRPWGTYGINE